MKTLQISRKLNEESYQDRMDNLMVERPSKFDYIYSNSIKKFFIKLRGTTVKNASRITTIGDQEMKCETDRSTLDPSHVLIHPSIKIEPSMKRHNLSSLSLDSKQNYQEKNKGCLSSTVKNNHFRRNSNPCHTLDLSTMINDNSGVTLEEDNSHLPRGPHAIRESLRYKNTLSSSNDSIIQKRVSSFNLMQPSKSSISLNEGVHLVNNLHHEKIKDASLSFSKRKQDEEECFLLQKRLWEEDITLCSKEQISEFLGLKNSTRQRILQLYMNNFDFSNQRLDNAFRILCSKLYMKAESQQLDRIIQAFSKRYFECNKNTLLLSLDIVYAVAYSLLLLNTDLHVVGGGRATKMSKSSFVKNTMETIQSLILPEIEQCEECLSTISYYQHKDSSPLSQVNNSPSSMSHIVFNEKNLPRDNSISQRVEDNDMLQRRYALSSKLSEYDNLITCTQEVWLTEIEGLLKEMYAAVKAHRIDQAVTSNKPKTDNEGPRSIQRSKTLPKNICKETQGSLHMKRKRGYSFIQPFESSNHSITNFFLTDNDLASLFTTLKKEELYRQGLVMRKHLMKSTNKRANHRQWQLCYLVMTDSELIMYKPAIQQRTIKDYIKGKSRLLWNYYSSNSLFSLQDIIQHYPYWQANKDAPWMDILQMNHTYTTAIPPPGWNPQRPHVFRLETNEGGVWLFESTDQFAVQAWVEVCNLTAAKISKGPLLGAICNVNYGWKDINDYCNTGQQELVRIWYPPMPCMINSFLNIDEQYDDIKTQIEQLRKELDEHRKLKLLVDKKFIIDDQQGCTDSIQAIKNWDRKLHYILQEMAKLRCYRDILITQMI